MRFSYVGGKNTLLVAAWLTLAGIGFWHLAVYSNTPGASAKMISSWPAGSKLPRSAGLFTLVLFAHPDCPCTNASLEELARLLPSTQGKMKNLVVFVDDKNPAEKTAATPAWDKASSLLNTEAIADGGSEATLFGAKTSGQVFVFDVEGKITFQGGITASRGHVGDNNGRTAVRELAAVEKTNIIGTPVYGCALLSANESTSRGSK